MVVAAEETERTKLRPHLRQDHEVEVAQRQHAKNEVDLNEIEEEERLLRLRETTVVAHLEQEVVLQAGVA